MFVLHKRCINFKIIIKNYSIKRCTMMSRLFRLPSLSFPVHCSLPYGHATPYGLGYRISQRKQWLTCDSSIHWRHLLLCGPEQGANVSHGRDSGHNCLSVRETRDLSTGEARDRLASPAGTTCRCRGEVTMSTARLMAAVSRYLPAGTEENHGILRSRH
jgi:hypothetical protein